MNVLRTGVLLVLLAAAAGCAAAGTARPVEADWQVITSEEIRSSGARDAYEVVERLRPLWLRSRGARSSGHLDTEILVYLNGSRMGGPDALRSISMELIGSIRYLDGPRATAELPGIGSRHVEGAIVITTLQS
jgi:hypothetical protein